jgi:DNA adenine methylase
MAHYTKDFGLQRFAYDIHPDLIMMYHAIQSGWLPPEFISEELYNDLKCSSASALRGYVGFACSFGGKWFGGYARVVENDRRLDQESYRRIIKNRADFADIYINQRDYTDIPIHATDIIYCDPPYANTLGYDKKHFDTLGFWQEMRIWGNYGAAVIISEYEAPDDFKVIWEKPRKTYMQHKTTKEHIERLFMWKG